MYSNSYHFYWFTSEPELTWNIAIAIDGDQNYHFVDDKEFH